MNPLFNQMHGIPSAPQPPMTPVNMLQGAIERAMQIAGSIQNPSQLLQRYLPGVPQNIMSDPNQIINWLQQTGRVTPQQIQTASQLMNSMKR